MVPPFAERLTRLSLELGRLDQALRRGEIEEPLIDASGS